MHKFKTRKELAQSLGLSYPTFFRKIKDHNIKLSKGLISPVEQDEIMHKLGFPVQNDIVLNNDVLHDKF